jgi:hypothetical protein
MSFKPDAVLCSCNALAVQRTTMKQGANLGRKFYACAKNRESGCGFFLWADAGPTPNATVSSLNSSTPPRQNTPQKTQYNNTPTANNAKRHCDIHNQDLIRRQVQNDGPNKGKYYYKCPADYNCKSFVWDDNQDPSPQTNSNTPPQSSQNIVSNVTGWAYDVFFELVCKPKSEIDENDNVDLDSGADRAHETIEFNSKEELAKEARLLVRLPKVSAFTTIIASSLEQIEGAEKSMSIFNFLTLLGGSRTFYFPYEKQSEVKQVILKNNKKLPVTIHMVPEYVSSLINSYEPVISGDFTGSMFARLYHLLQS